MRSNYTCRYIQIAKKKKNNTKIEQEKHWFQPNGKKHLL